MHDIVIRGGQVADGTGAPAARADVAIDGDRITAVGTVDGKGRREIDAEGKVVTPGFVDVHTHLDAQLFWDPAASSSCWHGVTTVVLGNCGVTFAPVRPGAERYLAGMMDSVEDIPADTIMEGLPWRWETNGDYLRALAARPLGVNAGGMIGHAALRYYAMGERSLTQEPATAGDIAAMAAVLDEALGAGALGFSTSRSFLHTVPDGTPLPGTFARPDELAGLAAVLGRRGRGVIEVVPRIGERDGPERQNSVAEMAWMAEVSRASGRPLTFAITQSDRRPGLWAWVLEQTAAARAAGADLRPCGLVRSDEKALSRTDRRACRSFRPLGPRGGGGAAGTAVGPAGSQGPGKALPAASRRGQVRRERGQQPGGARVPAGRIVRRRVRGVPAVHRREGAAVLPGAQRRPGRGRRDDHHPGRGDRPRRRGRARGADDGRGPDHVRAAPPGARHRAAAAGDGGAEADGGGGGTVRHPGPRSAAAGGVRGRERDRHGRAGPGDAGTGPRLPARRPPLRPARRRLRSHPRQRHRPGRARRADRGASRPRRGGRVTACGPPCRRRARRSRSEGRRRRGAIR
jgi:Amidohydrolase family